MFKGLGNLGNIASMVGALQQLPEKMQELNEQMKSERVNASSQCGNVHVTMNGVGHVEEVKLEGELNPAELTARVIATPTPDQIPFDVNTNLIVDFYR